VSETNINIGAVRWGYREARAYRQRRARRRIVKIIVGLGLLLLVLAVLIGLGARSAQPARAQGIISPQPWCMVSAPQPHGVHFECIKPRAFIPIVEVHP
jgi:hypothetical protein